MCINGHEYASQSVDRLKSERGICSIFETLHSGWEVEGAANSRSTVNVFFFTVISSIFLNMETHHIPSSFNDTIGLCYGH